MRNVLIQLGALPILILAFVAISWALRNRHEGWIAAAACTLFVFVQTAFAMVPRLEYVQRNHTRDLADVLFVREYLDTTWEKRPVELPTVYSPFGRLELVWLEMKAKCYFDWWQTGGFIFHRDTAMEGQRRARIAAPFEIGRFRERRDTIDDNFKHVIERFLGQKLDGPPPTLDDLLRLCQEPGLNYVVLKEEFPGLYSASNGRLYVYECQQVLAAFAVND